MAQTCQVCNSSKRIQIDRELVSGKSLAGIARKYDVSPNSVENHRNNHLTRQMIKHAELRDILTGKNLIKIVEELLESAQKILRRTENDKKRYHIALSAIHQCRETIALLFDVAVKLREIREEEHGPQSEDSKRRQEKLSRLSIEELEIFRKLIMKMEDKHPGRRTDLERKNKLKKKREEKGFSPSERTLLNGNTDKNRPVNKSSQPLKRVRVKSEEMIDEFDQMRNRLNIPNHPEPKKPTSWVSP